MPKGSEILLSCLRAEGVDLVFGYPGGAIMPLYDALEGSGVRHILARHEQGAVFAAEGLARVTGKVGVAMATSGPGATNLVTGIADAKMDSVPLVCITGQVRSPLIGTDAFQETDVFGVTLSLTKWSRLVKSIEEIPAVIAEGFHWARRDRKSTRLNSSHANISYAVFCLKKKSVHRRIVSNDEDTVPVERRQSGRPSQSPHATP